jgi:hypothetical protein
MFTIVGTPESTERALMLLYSQLESEKERRESTVHILGLMLTRQVSTKVPMPPSLLKQLDPHTFPFHVARLFPQISPVFLKFQIKIKITTPHRAQHIPLFVSHCSRLRLLHGSIDYCRWVVYIGNVEMYQSANMSIAALRL